MSAVQLHDQKSGLNTIVHFHGSAADALATPVNDKFLYRKLSYMRVTTKRVTFCASLISEAGSWQRKNLSSWSSGYGDQSLAYPGYSLGVQAGYSFVWGWQLREQVRAPRRLLRACLPVSCSLLPHQGLTVIQILVSHSAAVCMHSAFAAAALQSRSVIHSPAVTAFDHRFWSLRPDATRKNSVTWRGQGSAAV